MFDSLFGSSSAADEEPSEEELHEELDASIGDTRIYVRPMGEVFEYSEQFAGKFFVTRQRYKQTATHSTGAKYYGWREGKTLFRGTVEEWEAVKAAPGEHFTDIPAEWEEVVAHVDGFLDIHGNQLDTKEYPHGVLNL